MEAEHSWRPHCAVDEFVRPFSPFFVAYDVLNMYIRTNAKKLLKKEFRHKVRLRVTRKCTSTGSSSVIFMTPENGGSGDMYI